MKRTTIFLTDELEQTLREAARRTRRPQSEVMREALKQYFRARPRPWPRSFGASMDADPTANSENVKDWVHSEWRKELAEANEEVPNQHAC